jgi:hypothetical protein
MASGEPRVELDMPTLIVTRFGTHIEMENGKSLESLITPFFEEGNVISLHIVAEFTGVTREFCKYVHVKWGGACAQPLIDGVCRSLANHEKETAEHESTQKEMETETE